MQRRFCVKPRDKAVGLPLAHKTDRYLIVSSAIDRERDSDAVFVECIWQHTKVSDEKNRRRQCDVNRARE